VLKDGSTIGRLKKPVGDAKTMVDRQPFSKGAEDAWDCWCPACDWSGDILPDH